MTPPEGATPERWENCFPSGGQVFRKGSSAGYPPERVVMLQECQVIRKYEAPGRGVGQ